MHIGHVGLYVSDFDAMLAFYQSALGLVLTDCERAERRSVAFLSRDPAAHHQLVLITGRPKGAVSADILNQLSFKFDSLDQLQQTYHDLVQAGARNLEPLTHGTAWSVYFRDPEGNRLEVYVDTPWYITQPHRTPMDLTRPIPEIVATTEALCRADPSFQMMSDWVLKGAASPPS